MIKKIIISIVAVCAFIIFPYAVSAQTLSDGALLRARGESKIFVLFHGQKYWVRTAEIFDSYKFKWSDVKDVAPATLNAYPDVQTVKSTGDAKVYHVQGEEKRWVRTPAAFNANNFNWNAIKPVNAVDFNHYKNGTDIQEKIAAEGATVTLEITPISLYSDVPPGVDFSLLWNTWKTVQEKYKGSGKLDQQKMVEGAAEGMLKSLGDPYTVLFKQEESKKFAEDIAGAFGGIGAELGYRNGIVIIAPLSGMAAERVGIKAGDKIVKVDDESTIDMTVEEAVTRIRGEKGAEVKLLIERAGTDTLLEFRIVRETIKVPTIQWSKKTNDIAYIKIHNFFGAVENDFVNAVKEAQAGEATKLIIDLRDNPGGLLDASINIAAQFVPKGKIIVSADFGEGKNKNEFISPGGGIAENMAVVVLINGGSASASEILAGALKDSKGATLIGEKSFGKGTIQEVIRLPGGTTMKITTAQWLRPSGKAFEEHGIDADIVLERTDEDRQSGRDPQLDRALNVLQGM
ncbi:MAG: S41 family peptidase [Candidatus Azambacteria bacterium]|nr:S41 family peptidase [Candidatus Azambacteria bacterium]